MTSPRFNPPPNWPAPPAGWVPPIDWQPDPNWAAPPYGWQLWITENDKQPDPSLALVHGTPEIAYYEVGDDGSTEAQRLRERVEALEAEIEALKSLVNGVVDLDDERVLQEVGIYRYHHPLENAVAFRSRLDTIQQKTKETIREGRAIFASDMFTYNNSLAKGRKIVSDFGKLMLRAYNAEADNCVRSLRAGNVATAKNRLSTAVDAIAKLGAMMEMRINPAYHDLRIEEIELTGDWLMKVQEERELAREEREQLREERRAQQELEAERQKLNKERLHFVNALAVLRANGDELGSAELADKLADLDAAIAKNDYRIANIRAGYVYVISNVGSFGPGLVKIGLTRRLEPTDRIRELGDASVPFLYDTHALFFSDDAVSLEKELHTAFFDRRVNWVNERREFFFATPSEVREVLTTKLGSLLEYWDEPNAIEFHQSRNMWPGSGALGTPSSSSRHDSP
jgi:Domain of unknown function (DUF4041)/T5orf172 domain